MSLCAGFMPQRKQDGRERPGPVPGQVQIGRDVEFGLALEDDLFDAKILALDYSDGFRVQRRALGQAADIGENLSPEFSSARFDRSLVSETRPVGEIRGGFAPKPCG